MLVAARAVIIYTGLGGIQNANRRRQALLKADLFVLTAVLAGCKEGRRDSTTKVDWEQFLKH